MKLCFYSPYFPKHFGGGEKHLLDVALEATHQNSVYLAIQGSHRAGELISIKNAYEKFYGSSLAKIHFIETPLGTPRAFEKLWWTKNFDGIYYVTDGSLFFSLAKKNYLHIQIPFTVPLSPVGKIKLKNWTHLNTNSEFTKQMIEKVWQRKVDLVLHPGINTQELATTTRKEKIILSVGRFFRHLHSKRQDILVDVFASLIKKYPLEMKEWKLVLIGAVEDEDYFAEIQKKTKNLPIEIIGNVKREELVKNYKKASIYWHAAGFGVDVEEFPEKVEHFGITTVEAMAAGTIPLVVPLGGQSEVLGPLVSDLSWNTITECADKTIKFIKNPKLLEEYRSKVENRAKYFGVESFKKKVTTLFSS